MRVPWVDVGVGRPKSVVVGGSVYHKVVVFLKNCIELTILTNEALTLVQYFVNSKGVC